MRILVTGANGQVGYHLVQQLKTYREVELLALDRTGLNITDQTAVLTVVKTFRPEFIVNAAAYTAVDQAESEPNVAMAINGYGARHLAEAAHLAGAVMLHISTDYVFNGQSDKPYREEDATAPQGAYGLSKLAGEQAIQMACPRSIILRTAWVFGEHGNNFVKTMLQLGTQRDTLGIVADQRGAPTYAGDIASALIHIIKHIAAGSVTNYGIYHFSGYPYVSWYQFATAIFRQAQVQGILATIPTLNAISTADYPTPAKRPANSCLKLDKIHMVFGIVPSDWQQALADLWPYSILASK